MWARLVYFLQMLVLQMPELGSTPSLESHKPQAPRTDVAQTPRKPALPALLPLQFPTVSSSTGLCRASAQSFGEPFATRPFSFVTTAWWKIALFKDTQAACKLHTAWLWIKYKPCVRWNKICMRCVLWQGTKSEGNTVRTFWGFYYRMSIILGKCNIRSERKESLQLWRVLLVL